MRRRSSGRRQTDSETAVRRRTRVSGHPRSGGSGAGATYATYIYIESVIMHSPRGGRRGGTGPPLPRVGLPGYQRVTITHRSTPRAPGPITGHPDRTRRHAGLPPNVCAGSPHPPCRPYSRGQFSRDRSPPGARRGHILPWMPTQPVLGSGRWGAGDICRHTRLANYKLWQTARVCRRELISREGVASNRLCLAQRRGPPFDKWATASL